MRERLFKLFGALILSTSLVFGWYLMDYQNFQDVPLAVPDQGYILTVTPGSSVRSVAQRLQQDGITQHARYFSILARLSGDAQAIQAGEYRIEPGTRPAALLRKMVRGEVVQYTLTLVEGWDFRQVMGAIAQVPQLKQTLAGNDPATIMAILGHPDEHPEGRFFPDTYHFPRGTSDQAFLQRAYQAMQQHLSEEWASRQPDLPLDTAYQALILASIVEKETGQAGERPQIAGVFIRRLRKGMRLQTDPTVIYGLGPDFDGNLRRRDLESDANPYNTYRHRGLPPTPIAMPGLAAIHAALHPAPGNSLYFVAKGDGSHHFSATLREHNRAVIRYQLKGHNRSFSSHKAN